MHIDMINVGLIFQEQQHADARRKVTIGQATQKQVLRGDLTVNRYKRI